VKEAITSIFMTFGISWFAGLFTGIVLMLLPFVIPSKEKEEGEEKDDDV
jgi:hypothetical protein